MPVTYIKSPLTDIKLKAFLYVGVAAASRLVMLFQHQDSLPRFGQRCSSCQPTDAAPDDNDIQVLGHFVKAETWAETHRADINVVKCIFLVQTALIKMHCKCYHGQVLKLRHQNVLHNCVT